MSEIFKPHEMEVYKHWIRRISEENIELNDWETEFCISLYKRLDGGFNLTQAQADKLESIYVRTS